MRQKKYRFGVVILLLCGLLLSGCTGLALNNEEGETLAGAAGVYTLVNLRPDEKRARLFATNYQQAGFIPLCTEVKISKTSRKVITFTDLATNIQYDYYYHRSAGEPFDKHLLKYFGKTCNKDKVAKLSKVDQEGIKAGAAKVGMSKEGVILAIGYPPMHRTPSLQSDQWVYWRNRWATMQVVFVDGKVSRVGR